MKYTRLPNLMDAAKIYCSFFLYFPQLLLLIDPYHKMKSDVSPQTTITTTRKLTISKPTPKDWASSSLKSNIIVVVKFDFEAEGKNELSIKKGDILKLLDRPGNGWLLVKFIDKIKDPGLIPAFYVDIAINDVKNPITLAWLQTNTSKSSENDTWVDESSYLNLHLKGESKDAPLTINNKPYPISVSISNFLLYKQRYWYRLDILYSDNTKSYICRYYQDFYNLHINLLTLLNKSLAPLNETLRLPKLPEPIPSQTVQNSNEDGEADISEDDKKNQEIQLQIQLQHDHDQIKMLLKRCNDLNIYINRLILNKNYQFSETLLSWLDLSYKDLPGFNIQKEEDISNDEVNSKILPESINVIQEYYSKNVPAEPKEADDEVDDDEPIPFIPVNLPKRTKSKNIYNHYQQAANYNITRSMSASNKERNKSNVSTPNTSVSSTESDGGKSPRNKPYNSNNAQSNNIAFNFSNSPNLPNTSNSNFPNSYNSPKLPNSYNSPNLPYTPKSYPTNSPNSTRIHSPPSQGISPKVHPQLLQRSVSSAKDQYIKCKIINFNNEIIAIKIKKSLVRSTNDFKVLITQKVCFGNLYIKLPNLNDYQNIDKINFSIVDFLKFNSKVLLKVG